LAYSTYDHKLPLTRFFVLWLIYPYLFIYTGSRIWQTVFSTIIAPLHCSPETEDCSTRAFHFWTDRPAASADQERSGGGGGTASTSGGTALAVAEIS